MAFLARKARQQNPRIYGEAPDWRRWRSLTVAAELGAGATTVKLVAQKQFDLRGPDERCGVTLAADLRFLKRHPVSSPVLPPAIFLMDHDPKDRDISPCRSTVAALIAFGSACSMTTGYLPPHRASRTASALNAGEARRAALTRGALECNNRARRHLAR
jgi:hypothetical protein